MNSENKGTVHVIQVNHTGPQRTKSLSLRTANTSSTCICKMMKHYSNLSRRGRTPQANYSDKSDITALTCGKAVAKSVRPDHPSFSFSILCWW